MFNARAILGLEENASTKRIKQAYREKAALHHPDKGGSAEMMKLINQARDELLQQAEDLDFVEVSMETLDEILRQNVPEHLDTFSDRISIKYKALYDSFEAQFKGDTSYCLISGHTYFKKFTTDLYYDVTLDDGEVIVTDYKDLFDLIVQKKSITDCEELEVLSKPFTPQTAIELFIQFIEGQCFGNNLIKAKELVAENLKIISSIHPTYDLYNGILKILFTEGVTLQQEHFLLYSLNYIMNFIRKDLAQTMPYCVKLLQNVYFRNLFSQALNWFWKGGSPGLTIDDRTEFHNLAMTKSYLGFMAKQVLDSVKTEQSNPNLLKTTAYIKKLYEFEEWANEFEKKPTTIKNLKERAFATLDWLTVLMPYASLNIIVNMLMQAGIYFQLASFGTKTVTIRKRASEKLALHVYTEAFGVARRSSPDLEIYVLNNCLKFIAAFNYQDNDYKESIDAMQTRALVLADLFPVYIGIQSNIDFLLNNDQTLGLMRSFLHSLVGIIEQNKSLSSPIPIEHEHVKVLYQAYEACIKTWYQERYDPELENKFRLELMELLLNSNNWAFVDVNQHLSGGAISRDRKKWMALTTPLKNRFPSGDTFASLEGIEINSNTGEINFTFQENTIDDSSSMPFKRNHLLTIFDITEALSFNIMGASFSLDPVDPQMTYHPFNAMRFMPAQIYQTQFLSAMLLSDYILKFLTIGQEVQGFYPYDLRPIQDAIAHLPQHLKKIIEDFHAASQHKDGSIHRFWIEAEQLSEAIEETSGVTKVALSDVKMVLKKHTMERDPHGNLVDTIHDHEGWDVYILTIKECNDWGYKKCKTINGNAIILSLEVAYVYLSTNNEIYKTYHTFIIDEEVKKLSAYPREESGKVIVTIDNSMLIYQLTKKYTELLKEPHHFSPEYIFAQEFTLHYDEFAKHIEIFGRLKELSKITAAIRILNNKKYEAEQKCIHFKQLLKALPSWEERDSSTHPTNQPNYFDLPLLDADIPPRERDFAIFRHNNVKFIKNILPKNLCKRRGGDEYSAMQDFAEAKAQIKQMILASKPLLDKFEEIGLGCGVKDEDELELEKQCLWVPASVRHHVAGNSSQFVYGGVRVLPRVNSITSTNQNFSRMMGNAFATQNRVTVNAVTAGRTAIAAYQQTLNSSGRYSAYQAAPAATRAQAASTNFTSARPASASYQSASTPRQPASSNFTSARASTSSYQQASSSYTSRTQASSSFNPGYRAATASYQSSASAPPRQQSASSNFGSAKSSTGSYQQPSSSQGGGYSGGGGGSSGSGGGNNSSQGVSSRSATDRIQHEAVKTLYRQHMEKPSVQDPKLARVVDWLYRTDASIGSGSTADAARLERTSGSGATVEGKTHVQKSENAIKFMKGWLSINLTASPGDRAAAANILLDLKDGIGQRLWYSQTKPPKP